MRGLLFLVMLVITALVCVPVDASLNYENAQLDCTAQADGLGGAVLDVNDESFALVVIQQNAHDSYSLASVITAPIALGGGDGGDLLACRFGRKLLRGLGHLLGH